jgi:hypothetical protein
MTFNMASTYIAMGRMPEAEDYIMRSYNIRKKLHGEDHYTVGLCKMNLAKVLGAKDEFQEAIKLLDEARRMFVNQFGEEHQHVANCDTIRGNIVNV